MSDILIKGMKMPNSCEECWMTYEGDSDNCPVVNESVAAYMDNGTRHPRCLLVKVKPHGELIERDKILEYIEDHETLNIGTLYDVIQDAPTVLEAST